MHEIEWSDRALSDLGRLQAFLHSKNQRAASEAIDTIIEATDVLRPFPLSGRALSDEAPDFRELPIPYSNRGYIVLYRVLQAIVEIQAIKHMREDQY